MTKSPFAIALLPATLAAAALIALSGCETTGEAGQSAVAQSNESIQWNTPRPGEGSTTTVQPAPQAQPAQPVETMPPPPAAVPQRAPQAIQTGPECREYQQTVTIGGRPQQVYGRACRQPDGTWKQVGMGQPTPHPGAQAVEQSFPYGWHGYDYPSGPRYSVGVGGGSHGGFVGYGVGF